MSVWIALLRGINVGGANRIAMADLRAMFTEAGFDDPKTLLQSGNVVFTSPQTRPAELEAKLEAATTARFGIKVAYVVRSSSEIEAAVEANPFPVEAVNDPSHLLVMFLKEQPPEDAAAKIATSHSGPEKMVLIGRELYITYPVGIADSKLKVPFQGTARNWNTVTKLAALAKTY